MNERGKGGQNVPSREAGNGQNCEKPVKAEKLDIFPSCGYIGAGEVSDVIGVVQMILNALKVRYDSYDFLDLTLALDEPMQQALAAFREAHGLPEAEGVDVDTWNTLAGEYALLRDME